MTQSLLLISDNSDQLTTEITTIKSRYKVTPFNLFEIIPETSLGIDLVRKIRSILVNKNISGTRLVIVFKFETATDEAQNALLKLLEEPPSETILLLVSQNGQKILPTIYSRCQVIKLARIEKSEKEIDEKMNTMMEILTSRPGKRLQIAGNVNKNKQDALNFINSLLPVLKEHLVKPSSRIPTSQIAGMISKIEAARGYLETNVSSKGVLDVLFLGFPSL